MIELFLDNKRVVIASDQTIKICRENPLVTSSGDYTLEVHTPLSMLKNRLFFGPWNRIELRKKTKVYKARLIANNLVIFNGSAKVTSVSEGEVKLQLYGDRSEFNALFGDKYIDELQLPYVNAPGVGTPDFGGKRPSRIGFGGYRGDDSGNDDNDPLKLTDKDEVWNKYVCPSLYDETNGLVVNPYTAVKMGDGRVLPVKPAAKVPMFNLLFAIKSVFKAVGYDIDLSRYEREPYDHLIISSCSSTLMSSSLPHWTLKQFVEQLQYFFGAAFVFSPSARKITMVPSTSELFSGVERLLSEDSFSLDVNDEENVKSIGSSDLHYDLSSSEYHDTDYIERDKLDGLPSKKFSSLDELKKEYETFTSTDKGSYLMRCPEGDYCEWIYQGTKDTDTQITNLIHVNQFGDLVRDANRNTDGNTDEDNENSRIDIKICPIAMAEDIQVPLLYEFTSGTSHRGNPYGIETNHPIFVSKDDFCYQIMPTREAKDNSDGKDQGTFGAYQKTDNVYKYSTPIQDLIESEAEDSSSKIDRIELFFWDGAVQQATQYEFSGKQVTVNAPAVFTACDYKNLKGITHEKWSMTLNRDADGVKTIGELHNEFTFDSKQRYTVRFVSNRIPSVSDIFLIKNRRFFAEKIEVELLNGRINPYMTGYFYELNS